jgi:hypothetical protein
LLEEAAFLLLSSFLRSKLFSFIFPFFLFVARSIEMLNQRRVELEEADIF